MRGIGLAHALGDISGGAIRIFMVTEPDGALYYRRQFPQMVRFTPSPYTTAFDLVAAPDGSSALVRFTDFTPQDASTGVWEAILPLASPRRRLING